MKRTKREKPRKTAPRSETIEEFLARGGTPTIIPTVKEPEHRRSVSIKTKIDYDLMSLGEGEILFGESRTRKTTKKRVTNADFAVLVDSANLPADIVESLKRAMGKKQ